MSTSGDCHRARVSGVSGSREEINEVVRQYDTSLRAEFGEELFAAGWCLLLGRYYGQSKTVYFSLNPGLPRSRKEVDLTSWGEWNVPFVNPLELKREYVYLGNCERFFGSHPELSDWVGNGMTSAFLVPWRTRSLSELLKMDRRTGGKVLAYSRQIATQVLADHAADVVVAVGKAALELLIRMEVIGNAVAETAVLGPGGSYQWSRWRAEAEGRPVTILQIPHFSRANSAAKMRGLEEWLRAEIRRRPILAVNGQHR